MMLILVVQFQDRMWRKTVTNGTVCKGVDANRNWDDHWNGNVEYSTFYFIKTIQKTRNPYTLIDKALVLLQRYGVKAYLFPFVTTNHR